MKFATLNNLSYFLSKLKNIFVKAASGTTSGHVVNFGADGKTIADSGFTIKSNVPANAKFTDTVYTHPTTSGNKHIPSGGSSGQVLNWSASGTAAWGDIGNAASAAKLQTSRKINGVPFNGTADININPKTAFYLNESASFADTPWHKIASTTITNSANYDRHITFYVEGEYAKTYHGILKARVRTDSTKLISVLGLQWLVAAASINLNDFVLVGINNTDNPESPVCTAELWAKCPQRYYGVNFRVIDESLRTEPVNNVWTLYTSNKGAASYTESTMMAVSTIDILQNNVKSANTGANGTNIENYISDSGWKELAGGIRYRKIGKLVEVSGSYTAGSAGGGFTIGTLPEGYRPSVKAVTFNANDGVSAVYNTTIHTTGAVNISGSSASAFAKNSQYPVHIVYLVD